MADMHKAMSHHAQIGYALRGGDHATALHHATELVSSLSDNDGDEAQDGIESQAGPTSLQAPQPRPQGAAPAGQRGGKEMGKEKDIHGAKYPKKDVAKKGPGERGT